MHRVDLYPYWIISGGLGIAFCNSFSMIEFLTFFLSLLNSIWTHPNVFHFHIFSPSISAVSNPILKQGFTLAKFIFPALPWEYSGESANVAICHKWNLLKCFRFTRTQCSCIFYLWKIPPNLDNVFSFSEKVESCF